MGVVPGTPNFLGFSGTIFGIGVVEDRKDPDELNRVRVRVFGLHTENKQPPKAIKTEDLPWSPVLAPCGAGASGVGSGPHDLVEGSWVFLVFLDGENCQQPLVLGAIHGMPEQQPEQSKGFADPVRDAPLPIKSFEVDTNGKGTKYTQDTEKVGHPRPVRLSKSSLPPTAAPKSHELLESDPKGKGTLIEQVMKNAKNQSDIPGPSKYCLGAQTGGSISFSEKPSEWSPEYPYNKVTESESGHLIEVDDTPSAERLFRGHRTGTFEEIHPDGSRVAKVMNDDQRVVMRDDWCHVEGASTIIIDKSLKIMVNRDNQGGNDYVIEVGKGGTCSITVQEGDLNLNVLKGNYNVFVQGDKNERIEGSLYQTVTGDKISTIGGTHVEDVGCNVVRTAQASITDTAGQSFTRTAGDTIADKSSAKAIYQATQNLTLDSSRIDFAPGGQ